EPCGSIRFRRAPAPAFPAKWRGIDDRLYLLAGSIQQDLRLFAGGFSPDKSGLRAAVVGCSTSSDFARDRADASLEAVVQLLCRIPHRLSVQLREFALSGGGNSQRLAISGVFKRQHRRG